MPPEQLREAQQQAHANAATIQRLKEGLEDAMKVIAEISAQGFENTGIDPAIVTKAVTAAAEQIVKAAEQKLANREREFQDWKKRATKLLADLQSLIARAPRTPCVRQRSEAGQAGVAGQASSPLGSSPSGDLGRTARRTVRIYNPVCLFASKCVRIKSGAPVPRLNFLLLTTQVFRFLKCALYSCFNCG